MGSHDDLPEELLPIVLAAAKRLRRKLAQSAFDPDEVVQVLTIRAWLSLRHYNPAKGSLTSYLQTVVRNACANMLRDRLSRQDHASPLSSLLTQHLSSRKKLQSKPGEPTRQDLDARTGGHSEDEYLTLERRLDISDFIAKLPYRERELVRALKWRTITQLALDTGASRTSLGRRIKVLREKFEDAGLKDYLL